MFFPDPEVPYSPENFREISVEAALVFQATPSEGVEVSLAAILSHEGKDILFRFTLPRHSRTVRQIFRRGGLKEVPSRVETFNIEGLVPVSFDGTVVGEDKIREDLEKKPHAAYVVRDVKVMF